MNRSEELFFLIRSLTPAEKRHFKTLAKHHNSSEKVNNYVRLYDTINKMESYDEERLIKKYAKNGKQSEISTQKNHLFTKILEGMRSYKSRGSQSNKLVHTSAAYKSLEEARFLFQRGVIWHTISRLEKITDYPENQFHRVVLDACHLSRRWMMKYGDKEKWEKIQKIQDLEKNYLAYENLLSKIIHISDEIYLTLSTGSENDKAEKIEKFKELIVDIKEEDCCTFHTKKNFYIMDGGMALLSNNSEHSLSAYKKLIKLYDDYEIWRIEEISEYIGVIHNYLAICHHLERYDLFLEVIEDLKTIETSSLLLESRLFYTIANAELNYYANKVLLEEGIMLIPAIENGIMKYGKLVPLVHVVSIQYTIISLFFMKESFKEGLSWCDNILKLGVKSPLFDIRDSVHILLNIMYFELEEVDALELQGKRTKYYSKEHKRQNNLLEKVLMFIKLAQKTTHSKNELKLIRAETHKDILHNIEENQRGREEVLMWLTSRCLKLSIKEVAQAELHLKPLSCAD